MKLWRMIKGICPACGHPTLAVSLFGTLTCTHSDCPRPTAVAELLAAPQLQHVVQLERDDFTVQHPLIERLDGGLFTCELVAEISALEHAPAPPGRYLAHLDPTGLELTPTERHEP